MWLPYALRRLAALVPLLFGVALLVFLLFHAVGEDPARVALGQHASAESVARLRAQWGLDQPLTRQFAEFLRQVVRFDYGRSFISNETLSELLAAGAPVSLALTLPPFAIGFAVSVGVGLWLAYHRGRWLERLANTAFVAAMSVSYLVYIVVLQYAFAHRLQWFPVGGYAPGLDSVRYLALPWLIMLLSSLGPDVRIYRSIFVDESGARYAWTARAKGASELRVFVVHVLRNALIPVLTHALGSLPYLLLGAFLMERYFSLPGIGDLMVAALHNGDFPVIKGLTMSLALVYSGVLVITDLLYAWLDPRVRLR